MNRKGRRFGKRMGKVDPAFFVFAGMVVLAVGIGYFGNKTTQLIVPSDNSYTGDIGRDGQPQSGDPGRQAETPEQEPVNDEPTPVPTSPLAVLNGSQWQYRGNGDDITFFFKPNNQVRVIDSGGETQLSFDGTVNYRIVSDDTFVCTLGRVNYNTQSRDPRDDKFYKIVTYRGNYSDGILRITPVFDYKDMDGRIYKKGDYGGHSEHPTMTFTKTG